MLSATDTSANYAPTFVGNGYLASRVPAAGEGFSSAPVRTESELAGFYARPAGSYERRAALPTWTTLGFGQGSEIYGVPGNWSCAFDEICPAAYGHIFGGAFVESSHSGSTVGSYLAGLNTNNQPTVGGTGVVPIYGAPAGPATLDIRYSNGSGGPQTFSLGVNGQVRQLTVPTLAGWDDWAVLSVPVTLSAGDNTLEITVAPGDTARVNVDYLAVYPQGSAAPTKVASASVGSTDNYRQSLDMRTGTLTTSFDWTSPSGRRTGLTYAVNANRADGHLGTVQVTAVPHWSGTATVTDEFDGRGMEQATATGASVDAAAATMSETVVSDGDLVTAGMTSALRVDGNTVATTALPAGDNGTVGQSASFPVTAGQTYRITKYVGVASSADTDRALSAATPQQAATTTAAAAAARGYPETTARNDRAWAALWSSDISIPKDPAMTAQVRAAMFYLLESMRAGVTWSTSPGGLSSNGYNGHVFWDMETWMYPSLLAQHPDIAVGADSYRQKLLPAAEDAAAALSTPNHPINGAKFPWESAFSGAESTPPGNPEGTDEIHIDADIALAQWQYYQATGDTAWLRDKAWPVLKGIADYWASRAVPDPDGGYDINDVQPPDEYHDGVNNSVTTNAGAQKSLRIATQAAHVLGVPADPSWATVADGLKLPFDKVLGIHPEYDGYSGQTVKQADVTLLQYPWDLPMPPQVAQNDLDYYAKVTDVGGPSMTDAIASIDSSALGSSACSAYTYLRRSADPFLSAPFDQFHEARSGGAFTFTTGEGGYLQEFLYGFSGLRWGTDAITIDPSLPPQLPGVDLTGLKWHGRTFDLSVGPKTTTLTLRSGPALPVAIDDHPVQQVRASAPLHVATRNPAAAPTSDLARCNPVGTSSADPSYPAVAAVDGTDGTWWKPTQPGASLTVDLGQVTPVSRIEVRTPSYTTAYTVQGSVDDQHWTTLATQDQTAQATTSHSIQPDAQARYIRYVAAADATPQIAGLVVTGPRYVTVQAPAVAVPGQAVDVTGAFTNDGPQSVQRVSLRLAAPADWQVSAITPTTFDTVAAGESVHTTWRVDVPSATAPGSATLTATATYEGQTSGQAAIGGATVTVPYPSLAAAFNNTGISNDTDHAAANFDGAGYSWSAQALESIGITPGSTVHFAGADFTWPNVPAATPDNVTASGQTIAVSGAGAQLAFLGAGAFGNQTGTVTVTYTDGSTSTGTVEMSDWNATAATAGDQLVATAPHWNLAPGSTFNPNQPVSLFYSAVPLDAGKTVDAITLPDDPNLHIFAAAVSP